MTRWTAIVPIKDARERKTRLRAVLDEASITALTDAMLYRVIEAAAAVTDVVVVANERPRGWSGRLFSDRGGGLNRTLEEVALIVSERIVIVHADLPAIVTPDIEALIAAAGDHGAIAPDRAGTGTNGLAIRHAPPSFAFGPDSCARHLSLLPSCTLVRRPGLAFDLDNPPDLEGLVATGLLADIGALVASAASALAASAQAGHYGPG